MISLDTKSQTTTSSPLGLSTPTEEPTLSFSALLKGINPKKEDGKIIQNGTLVLSLAGDTKELKENSKSLTKDTLLSLLKSDEVLEKAVLEPLEINPKLTQNMSIKELKTLIANAKEYLKDKIIQSDDFKNAQIKELPKTLKGLTQLAQKVGVDISKITIEEVQINSQEKVLPKNFQSEELKKEVLVKREIKPEVTVKAEVKPEVTVKAEIKPEMTVKAEVKPEVTVKAEIKPEVTVKAEIVIKNELKPNVAVKANIKEEAVIKNEEIYKVENKELESSKQVTLSTKTLLFKAQVMPEHTTQQLVTTKQFKVDEKPVKSRADETLKLLLRGEKPTLSNTSLTSDFSVATARVIAPSTTSEVSKSLENLLHGEGKDTATASKLDGLTMHKADSFEVKINEAKQMIKYLSSDVKTAIEDYKSPFTRIKVQLNPQRLGEVDLTIVQRGKNLHVNISSNTTAITTLAANINELRVQLNNSGINNASLNFNNSSQSEQQNSSQQQNRQNEQEAHEEYNYFDNEEQNEEIISSLEIVVPNYA